MKNIGLFLDSFDPPCLGHRLIISNLFESCKIDNAIIVPIQDNALGENNIQARAFQRLEMCMKEFNGLSQVSICDIACQNNSPEHWLDILHEIYMVSPNNYSVIMDVDHISFISTQKTKKNKGVLNQLILYSKKFVHEDVYYSILPDWLKKKTEIMRVDPNILFNKELQDRYLHRFSIEGMIKSSTDHYIKSKDLYTNKG